MAPGSQDAQTAWSRADLGGLTVTSSRFRTVSARLWRGLAVLGCPLPRPARGPGAAPGGEGAAPSLRGVRAAVGGRGGVECRTQRGRGGGARAGAGPGQAQGLAAGQSPKASACLRAFSRRSAILEFLLLLLAAAATTAAAEAESARDAMGNPKGGGGNIR